MTKAAGVIEVTWQESAGIAKAADAAEFECMLPVARWKEFGGDIDFNHRSFETLAWAAGLAAITEQITLFSTTHVPTIYPVRAAMETATIDHISGGRLGLRISPWR